MIEFEGFLIWWRRFFPVAVRLPRRRWLCEVARLRIVLRRGRRRVAISRLLHGRRERPVSENFERISVRRRRWWWRILRLRTRDERRRRWRRRLRTRSSRTRRRRGTRGLRRWNHQHRITQMRDILQTRESATKPRADA